MLHLKLNVALVRPLAEKGVFYSKGKTMVGAFVLNLGRLHYFMQWIRTPRKK
jgi:predicted transcriptional regulator YheO